MPWGYGQPLKPLPTKALLAGTDLTTQRATFTNSDTPLGGFASLQNLTAGQVVTFELGFYSPANGQTIEIDNLVINGNVTIPEPGSAAIMSVGLLSLLVRRKRRG